MGKLVLFDKQDAIWNGSRNPKHRNLVFCGGIQCGKTTLGAALSTRAAFLYKDYPDHTGIIAAPTFPILKQATLPKFLATAHGYGVHHKQENKFVFNWGFTIYFRTAVKPESMEGIPNCRFVWLDEGGLVPLYFFENCMGRVARLEGPILITTTPYAMNWLAKMAEDVMKKRRDDTLLVQLRSVDSPYFPKSEYDRQKKLLDPRRFAMKYEGQFGKMQGLVYPEVNYTRSHQLPEETHYYAGVDWGYTDPFAIVDRAFIPSSKIHIRIGEYVKTEMIASDIINVLRARHAIYKYKAVICDPSRPEYIAELQQNGIPAVPANNDIKLGIDIHRGLTRDQRFFVWEDTNPHGVDEYNAYHYPEPQELGFDDDSKDQDPVDSHNHTMDGDRYVSEYIERGVTPPTERITPKSPAVAGQYSKDIRKRIEQLKKGIVRKHY
jgi:hypothetical protein